MRMAKKQSSPSWCTASTLVTGVVLVAVLLMGGVLYSSKGVLLGMDGRVGADGEAQAHGSSSSSLSVAPPTEGLGQRLQTTVRPGSIRNTQRDHETEHQQQKQEEEAMQKLQQEQQQQKQQQEQQQQQEEEEEAKQKLQQEKEEAKQEKQKEQMRKEAAVSSASAASDAGTSTGTGKGGDSKDSRGKVKPKKEKKKSKDKALHGESPDVHNFHDWFSPRNGSDIDTPAQQLDLLKCHNQAKCVVPQLQLQKKQKVYMCIHPTNHGVRFYFLVKEGLLLHPNVELMDSYEEALEDPRDGGADYIVYLPGSSPWHRTECTDKRQAGKLIVMDEFDGPTLFFPYKTADEVAEVYGKDMRWYDMYFKRSFVQRRDGKFLKHPHLNKLDVYPLTYAITEAYLPDVFQMERTTEILCTLRGNNRMQTRLRVQNWMQEYVNDTSKGVTNAVVGQINKATRSTLSKDYFDNMHNAQIIVTVSPANWEGDFRLWESLSSGALVFTDPIFVPHPYSLIDGVHCVFFHNNNREELFEKMDYYRKNSGLARRIAIQGYLHALKYHRTVNLMDYVLRSAHLKSALFAQEKGAGNGSGSVDSVNAEAMAIPEYTYTGQYLNHQTRDQSASIKKSNLPADFQEVVGVHHGDHEPHALVTDYEMPSAWH